MKICRLTQPKDILSAVDCFWDEWEDPWYQAETSCVRCFLLLAFLSVLLAGVGCGKRSANGIAIDPAFSRLIPQDTKVLAGIAADSLRSSAFYNRHQKQLQIPLIDAFSERVGLDPRRDLSNLLVTWNGKQPVFMAQGRFKQPELEQKFSSLGAQRSAYKRNILFSNGTESLFFATKGVAVAGSAGTLHGVIDARNDGTAGLADELKQRLEALPKQDQLWLVGRGGLPFAELPMRSDIGSALSNIVAYVSGANLGIGVDSGAHFQMDITCVSDQGAQRVRDGLRAGIGLARLTSKDNQQDLIRLYDAIHVEQDNQSVHVRADLPPDLADTLLDRLSQLQTVP